MVCGGLAPLKKPESLVTTIESALQWARNLLNGKTDSTQQDARWLLCHVLKVSPEFLLRYPDRTLTAQQISDFQRLVARRAQGEPLAYLIGTQGFYTAEFEVSPAVLIPRPETELLLEKALEWLQGRGHVFIVDVGTGSGILATLLARYTPNAHITAIDLSLEALEVARRNATRLGVASRIRFMQGDLLLPLSAKGEHADLIVANLPYVATLDLMQLAFARYEPHLALDGGEDGLAVIRRCIAQLPPVLRAGGLCLLEIGAGERRYWLWPLKPCPKRRSISIMTWQATSA